MRKARDGYCAVSYYLQETGDWDFLGKMIRLGFASPRTVSVGSPKGKMSQMPALGHVLRFHMDQGKRS